MVKYSKVNAKLTDTQIKKLKTAAKNKTGTALRMVLKMSDGNDLPNVLLVTTKLKTMLRNAFNKNISTDTKISKAQISKLIQSGGFLRSLLSKLAGPLMKVAVPLAKNIFAPLEITAAASEIDAWFEDNNLNNFRQANERHNGNRSSSSRFKYFAERSH